MYSISMKASKEFIKTNKVLFEIGTVNENIIEIDDDFIKSL